MDRVQLRFWIEDEGLSLPEIGRRVGRDPSTVGYWVSKHGLVANGRDKYAPRGGLKRAELEPLVEKGATLQEIADALGRSTSTVRHWLNKFGLRTVRRHRRKEVRDAIRAGLTEVEMTCPRHGLTRFFVWKGGRSRCARCSSEAVARRRRRVKQILISEAGGGCQVCGYDRFPGALQFHHVHPASKQFTISRRGITRSIAEARREAAKCVLLCANCHAEVEAGLASVPVQLKAV
ncbi:MAG: helix-turn-helix domain-containing protein [Haloechinothrix sp.]